MCHQSPTLCNPMDCSPPGSSCHGNFQARILEWVAISSSKGSSQPRNRTHVSSVSFIGRQILHQCATWEAPTVGLGSSKKGKRKKKTHIKKTSHQTLHFRLFVLTSPTWSSPSWSKQQERWKAYNPSTTVKIRKLTVLKYCYLLYRFY